MKKLLTVLLTVLSCVVFAQTKPIRTLGAKGDIVKALGQLAADSAMLFPKDTIQLLSTDRAMAIKGKTPFVWDGTKWNYIIVGKDTLYVEFPLYVDSVSVPGRMILKIRKENGLISGGVVTRAGCLMIDITPTIVNINYKQYVTVAKTLTVAAADPSFPRTDEVVVDTSGNVVILTGTPSATPTPVSINPATQFVLSTYTVAAGASCIGIVVKTIYDQDSTGEFTHTTGGTQTSGFADLVNPYHLSKAIRVTTYQNGASISFTDSGLDTVQLGEVIKHFFYFVGGLAGQIVEQFFNNTTPVSNAIVINPYFNPSDSTEYQNASVPFSAWKFITQNAVWNKVVLTFNGYDTTGAKGMYLDYIQLQTGGNNVSINPVSIFSVLKNTTRDSIIITMDNGTRFAVKDSVGTGGGGGTGTVTTVTGTAPVVITGTPTVTPNVTVDTSKAQGRIATYNDIILKQNQLNGTGFVKAAGTSLSYDNSTYLTSAVTNVATGYGLSGGPITSTGTLLIDSAALSLKYLRIVDTANMRPRLIAGSNVTITGTFPNLTIASSGGGTTQVTNKLRVTATGGQTAFTFSGLPASVNDYDIFLNGTYVNPTFFSATGTTVTFSTGLVAGDIVDYAEKK